MRIVSDASFTYAASTPAAAAPCAAAVLYLQPPQAFYALVPAYILSEAFLSVSTAVVVELVPADLRSSTVAVFAFLTVNVGGSLQLLLGPIVAAFQAAGGGVTHAEAFRMGLYLLFPGGLALSGLLFTVMLVIVTVRPHSAGNARDALEQYQTPSTDTLYGDAPPPALAAVASVA